MPKSEWKVMSNVIAGHGKMYRAYRILDTDQPMHSGNIECIGGYCEDRDAVQETVDRLNAEEKALQRRKRV